MASSHHASPAHAPDVVLDTEIVCGAIDGQVMVAFTAIDKSIRWEQWMSIAEAQQLIEDIARQILEARKQW